MSKYSPLSDHLAQRAEDDWRASFAEIEMVLGASLSKAARQPAWWIGADKPHQKSWLDHGWRVSAVGEGMVSFKRTVAHEVQPPALKAAAETASTQAHVRQTAGIAAAVGGAIAVLAGLGLLAAKVIGGRKST
jgi:hypothetical protein